MRSVCTQEGGVGRVGLFFSLSPEGIIFGLMRQEGIQGEVFLGNYAASDAMCSRGFLVLESHPILILVV